MIRCTHCGRRMKHASASGMGPVCARAVLGVKPRPASKQPPKRDELTPDMFAAESRIAQWFAAAPSLEMTT